MNKCKTPNCGKNADYQDFCKKHYFFTDGNKSELNDCNHKWKPYTISTVDLGKTIRFCDCGMAIIKEDEPI